MVVPRKWKLVAGAVSATVALGASAAAAQSGEQRPDHSILRETLDINSIGQVETLDDTVVAQGQNGEASPFDSVSAESIESESLPSDESEESPESESLPSEESPESESVPSEDSISADSND